MQFESLRAKAMMRPVVKRPKSILSLKKSLFINHSNLDDFVKYIKEPIDIFHTAKHKVVKEDPSLLA